MNSTKEYGEFLKEEREKRGLSLEEVSKDTKIMVRILQSLESMEKDVFPSETYRIGLLKNYAKYLKIDEEIILQVLKINEIQEKPVEFDVINIQTEKKQRRVKYFVIGISIIAGLTLLFVMYRVVSALIVNSAEKRAKTEQSTDKLERIDGFKEAHFDVEHKYLIVNGDKEAVIEIISAVPAIIKIGDEESELKVDIPILVDLDGDGVGEYVLALKGVNLSRKQLLLRFDPSIGNIGSITSDDLNSGINVSITKDGDVIEILNSFISTPIEVNLAFNEESYYKVLSENGEIHEEGSVQKGKDLIVTSDDPIHIYVSNSSFVDISINGIDVDVEKNGLPYTFYLGWETDDEGARLLLIPTP